MSGSWYVSSHVDSDGELTVHHHPARPYDLGGEIPESVHIAFGNVNVWGSPDVMATVLDRALTQVQSFMDDCEEENG